MVGSMWPPCLQMRASGMKKGTSTSSNNGVGAILDHQPQYCGLCIEDSSEEVDVATVEGLRRESRRNQNNAPQEVSMMIQSPSRLSV